jgi:hypothetical protein
VGEFVDEFAVEARDGDGLLEGEIKGVVDDVWFGGVGESRVWQRGEAETAEDGLEVGAGVAEKGGERALRNNQSLAAHEGPSLFSSAWSGMNCL